MYPYQKDHDVEPDIPSPTEMNFIDHLFDNKINILLSAYTLNHVLLYAGQSGMLSKLYRTEDGINNPWNRTLDTDGLATLIPEVEGKFDNPRKLSMRFVINSNNAQPLLDITRAGNNLNINFSLEIKVKATDDPRKFPETFLNLNITTSVKFTVKAINNNLVVNILSNEIKDVVSIIDKFGITQQSITPFLSNYVNIIIADLQTQLSNIDIVESLSKLVGVQFKELFFMTDNGFFDFSIDI
jgi:hypothetical protein